MILWTDWKTDWSRIALPLLSFFVVSLLVLAGIAGGVAAAGMIATGVRWALRKRPQALPPVESEPKALPAAPSTEPAIRAFGLALGDVVMLREGEAWLTGVVLIHDAGEDEAGLFFTDQVVEGDVLMVRPAPRRVLYLVRAVDLPAAALGPHSLEHEREIFTRSRQIPVTIAQHGQGCPAIGDAPSWAWFDSPGGDVLVCLQSASGLLAWRGREVDEGSTLRLAAGQATLREL